MPDLHPIARTRYIIDTHSHTGPYFFHMGSDDVRENLRMCEHWGITRQIVSASRGVFHDAVAGNEQMARDLEGNENLRGYAVINQRNLDMAEKEMDRWLQPGSPFVGVKVHTHYPHTTMSSPQLRDAFALFAQRRTVMLIHTWGTDVVDLARAVKDLDGLQVIAGHMGADRWDLAAEVANDTPNLWIEPSCSVALAGQMRHVMTHGPTDRVLLGTDSTLLDPAVAYGQIAAADLPQDQLEDVLWRNAVRLFGTEALGLPEDAAA